MSDVSTAKKTGDLPTVSRVFEDGTLVELLFNSTARTTALAVAKPDGALSIEDRFAAPTGEWLVPYSADNNLLTSGCVLLPSAFGEDVDKGDLLTAIRAYLHRYVDVTPIFEEIAAHYVLLTWVYDTFSEVPYLRFSGAFGAGKTRSLLVLGSICYKPFFASGASTVSPIFHILDAFQGTLILDEADFRFSDATAELTKVFNNGNMRGLPVLRTMQNRHHELNPTAFRVFGPKVVGMRGAFADDALESRFITEVMGQRDIRSEIPIHLPDAYRSEALDLRNQLLGYRLRHRRGIAIDPSRLIVGASSRLNQTALALLSMVDDPGLREQIGGSLNDVTSRSRLNASESLDAIMLNAVVETFEVGTGACAPIRDIADRFNARTTARFSTGMSNKWVGAYLRTRFGLATTKTRGLYVVSAAERDRVTDLAKKN